MLPEGLRHRTHGLASSIVSGLLALLVGGSIGAWASQAVWGATYICMCMHAPATLLGFVNSQSPFSSILPGSNGRAVIS